MSSRMRITGMGKGSPPRHGDTETGPEGVREEETRACQAAGPLSPLHPLTSSPLQSLRRPGGVLLISCYELGHQPLAVASPLAFLERAGFAPEAMDVAVE